MKKALFLLAALALVAGCGNVTSLEKNPEIISFLSDFIETHPAWNQNNVIKKQSLEILKNDLVSRLEQEDLLNSLPLKLVAVKEDTSGKYTATLEYSRLTKTFKNNWNKYRVDLTVVGNINDSLIYHIQEGSQYYVKGNYIRLSEQVFSPIDIESSPISYKSREDGTCYTFSLGLIRFDIKEMIPVGKKP